MRQGQKVNGCRPTAQPSEIKPRGWFSPIRYGSHTRIYDAGEKEMLYLRATERTLAVSLQQMAGYKPFEYGGEFYAIQDAIDSYPESNLKVFRLYRQKTSALKYAEKTGNSVFHLS